MLQFSFQQRFTLHLGFRILIALLEGVNVIYGRFVFVISTDQCQIQFATILGSCSSHLQPAGIPRPLPSLTDSTPRRTQFPIHQGVFVEKSTPSSSGSLSAEEASLSTGVELSSSSLRVLLTEQWCSRTGRRGKCCQQTAPHSAAKKPDGHGTPAQNKKDMLFCRISGVAPVLFQKLFKPSVSL